MATLGVMGRSTILSKILLCTAVAIAGLVAGRLSVERPSEQVISAPRRNLADPEKKIIAAALGKTSPDVTVASITWPQLILASREGISDYCGIVRGPLGSIAFYTQLIFAHADPRGGLGHVNFAIVATPDDLQARYVVGTACLRYGYGTLSPPAP